MRYWLKSGDYRPGRPWTVTPETMTSLHSPKRPRFEIGDRVAMYAKGIGTIPLLVEVTSEAYWAPKRTEQRAEDEGWVRLGDWGYVNDAVRLKGVQPDDAPHISALDRNGAPRTWWELSPQEWRRLGSLIDQARR